MEILIVMVLVLVVLYVLTIRPQRQRQMAQQATIERAGVGDDVLTNGGIYGTITEAEGDDLVVEIADGFTVHMTRRGIAAVLPPEEDEDEDEIEEEAGDEVDSDVDGEASVRAEEEAVTSEPDAGTATAERR